VTVGRSFWSSSQGKAGHHQCPKSAVGAPFWSLRGCAPLRATWDALHAGRYNTGDREQIKIPAPLLFVMDVHHNCDDRKTRVDGRSLDRSTAPNG
jgi:hypothetical protein